MVIPPQLGLAAGNTAHLPVENTRLKNKVSHTPSPVRKMCEILQGASLICLTICSTGHCQANEDCQQISLLYPNLGIPLSWEGLHTKK